MFGRGKSGSRSGRVLMSTPCGPSPRLGSVLVGAAALARREGVAAAAGGGGVRGLDREAAAHQVFLVVDLGPLEVAQAHGVDDDLHALGLDFIVSVDLPP